MKLVIVTQQVERCVLKHGVLICSLFQDLLICSVLLMESVNVSPELLATSVTVVKLTTGTSQKKQIQGVSHVTVWWKEAREIGESNCFLKKDYSTSFM